MSCLLQDYRRVCKHQCKGWFKLGGNNSAAVTVDLLLSLFRAGSVSMAQHWLVWHFLWVCLLPEWRLRGKKDIWGSAYLHHIAVGVAFTDEKAIEIGETPGCVAQWPWNLNEWEKRWKFHLLSLYLGSRCKEVSDFAAWVAIPVILIFWNFAFTWQEVHAQLGYGFCFLFFWVKTKGLVFAFLGCRCIILIKFYYRKSEGRVYGRPLFQLYALVTFMQFFKK